jgi:hypothetical protein
MRYLNRAGGLALASCSTTEKARGLLGQERKAGAPCTVSRPYDACRPYAETFCHFTLCLQSRETPANAKVSLSRLASDQSEQGVVDSCIIDNILDTVTE